MIKAVIHADTNGHHNYNGNGSDDISNKDKQDKTEETSQHKHNYELVSFEEPTSEKEGKAVYRCTKCGHELVITYPVSAEEEKKPVEKPEDEKKEVTPDDALAIALKLVEGGLSKNEAAKETAKQTGLKKSDIYKLLQNGD